MPKQYYYKYPTGSNKVVFTVVYEDSKGVLLEWPRAGNVPEGGRTYETLAALSARYVEVLKEEYVILHKCNAWDSSWVMRATLGEISEFEAVESLAQHRKNYPTYTFKLFKGI